MAVAARSIREPDPWHKYEGNRWKWTNIHMKELVADDLPGNAVEGIRRAIIDVNEVNGDSIVDVRRLDGKTVEIVYYGDEFDQDRPDDELPSKVPNWIVDRIQNLLIDLFGPLWRVRRKEDTRRRDGESIQRLVVQRIVAQRFRYEEESHAEYLFNLHGSPEGVPEGVERYGDLESIPTPPEPITNSSELDMFVYESSAGTKHLIRGSGWYGLRQTWVVKDVECLCGHEVDNEAVIDGEVRHLAGHIADHAYDAGLDLSVDDPSPDKVFGDDLCGSCWRSYCGVDSNGDVDHPTIAFLPLLRWAEEGEHD